MAQVLQLLEPSLPTFLFFFSLLLLLLGTIKAKSKQANLPPSPPKLPFIGHLHLVGALPHHSLRDLSKKHGHLMLLRLGTVPNLVVSSPAAASAITKTHDLVFASRPRSAVADILLYGSKDVGLATYGEHWRQGRKLVMTHLLSTRKVQSFRLAREEEARLVLAKIREAAASSGAAGVVDMSEVLNSFTNDIVCRAVSGKFFRGEGRNKVFRELTEVTLTLLGGFNIEDYFPSLAWVDALTRVIGKKAMKARERWDELLETVISDHSNRVNKDAASCHDSDFVDLLLSLQEEYGLTRGHVKAILVDMFAAGTQTPYLVLEWAMTELMCNEQAMTKLQHEVRSRIPKRQEMVREEDVGDMNYLKAVIKETLRLHPPAPLLLPHESMEDCNVEGYKIPKGTRVIINAWAICRDPNYWDKAEVFKPERFIDDDTINFKGADFRFIPFGSGRRICPGINFAMHNMELMLANLVYRFNWELPPCMERESLDMSEVFGLTVHRKEKLLLVPKLYGN